MAYTIGDTITLNAARLDTRSNSSIAQMTGANHHEVGHLLFSPRAGDDLHERLNVINAAGGRMYYPTYNILEDARIERLLIARHPSMKPFLTLTVTELLVNVDDEDLASSYPLIAGRTYLPDAVRAASRQAYVYPDDVDELDRISQAYARLTFPGDEAEAFALIKAFHALIDSVNPPQQCSANGNQTDDPEDADQQRTLQLADAELGGDLLRVDRETEAGRQPPDLRLHGLRVELAVLRDLAAEEDVGRDGEGADELEVLEHHPDAERGGLLRAGDRHLPAVVDDRAGVGHTGSVDHRHERRLPGAVLADEGVDQAGSYVEVDVVVGDQ
ncbi:MAG TPA: hypothetical protein VLS51_11030 [Propionibacteriaceae bacterium]|nr:hypothetical protein [Propionibacteriaceae bacterium]